MSRSPFSILKLAISGWFVILLLLVGVLYAAFGVQLPASVIISGKISASSFSHEVKHLQGGMIRELLVHEGQKVEKGDVLLRLSDIEVQARLKERQSRRYSLKLEEVRLLAEQTGGLSWPRYLLIEGAEQQRLRELERKLFHSRVGQHIEQQKIIQHQMRQLKLRHDHLTIRHQVKESTWNLLKDELESVNKLNAEKLITTREFNDIKSKEMSARVDWLETVSQMRQVEEMQEQLKAELEKLRLNHAQTIGDALKITREKLRVTESEITPLKEDIWLSSLRAPVSGRVMALSTGKVGEVLEPGQAILRLIPDDEPLLLIGWIKVEKRELLTEGLKARIRLKGKEWESREVVGTLIHLSADSVSPDSNTPPHYICHIHLEADDEQFISAGLSAVAHIDIEKRSLMSYLLEPFLEKASWSFSERPI